MIDMTKKKQKLINHLMVSNFKKIEDKNLHVLYGIGTLNLLTPDSELWTTALAALS
jgi:hypothetical protein